MNSILAIQNTILQMNPGLIPLTSLFYSFLTSPHCTVMCSAFSPQVRESRDLQFLGRTMGYTLVGGTLGFFGKAMHELLEVRAVAVVVFLLFAALTLLVAGFNFLPHRVKSFWACRSGHISSPFWRGILYAAMPCQSLHLFYSLAVLTLSPWGGALVLLGHSLATIPALSFGQRILKKVVTRFRIETVVFRLLILALCLVNLAYFGSRLFYTAEESKSKVVFCF